MKNFRALVTENVDGNFISTVKERSVSDLPEGDVLINVKYSSLNYKDGLSSIGNKGVTRNYPHTPGIDAAGVVEESSDPRFKSGDEVIVTGYSLGMSTSGGFSEYIRVPAGWVVKKPKNIGLRESMIYGTAGFTSALSVLKLTRQGLVTPDMGKIAVTGSTGGVGSVAVAMLSGLGFDVTAFTGKADKVKFLEDLGAKEVLKREDIDDQSGKPLLKPLYAGGVDSVGGNTLHTLLKSTKPFGAVTACGLTQSMELNMTVFPFILRGVSLLGIDSVELPVNVKEDTWASIAGELAVKNIEDLAVDITLDDLPEYLKMILKGETSGRVVVKI